MNIRTIPILTERDHYVTAKTAHFINEGLDLIFARNMANLMADMKFHVEQPWQVEAKERIALRIDQPTAVQAEYQKDWTEDQERDGGIGR
jgi:hypothetical protein